MMIKVNNEFLDFNDLIEMEKQIKLFEELSTTDGDFSYSFELAKTITNTRILQNPLPDNISKIVYQKIPATLLSDSGAETYKGYLRVERVKEVYHCSFFAGNNNWFGMLSGKLQDIDWSQYDINQTQSNIQNAIFNTSGVVFPLLDNGGLLTRGFPHVKVEDFVAGIYVKDVFNKIFSSHGIKIQGELLNDVNYLTAITLSSGKDQSQIDARSAFVHTTFSARALFNTVYKTVFTDDSNFPYFDGESNNYNLALSRYVADVKMIVKVDLNLTTAFSGGSIINYMYFYVNGVQIKAKSQISQDVTIQAISMSGFVPLEAGDYLEIFTEWTDLFSVPANNNIVDGTIKITPTFIYKAFGNSMVPDWTQQEYVSNILRLWNCLASYNDGTKTLTFNLFERIKDKTAIDLSPYISDVETDYSEFISQYGKKSNFVFQELDDEDLKLTRNPYFKFDKGSIDVDNDFLNDSVDIIESDFSAPNTYIHPVFDMSMEKTQFITLEEEISVEATGVTDSFGQARFAIPTDEFLLSDLVRVENSTNPIYNGDWMVESALSGWVELSGLAFDTNATARITKLNYQYTDSDDVFLFHQVPLYSVPKFSGSQKIRLENTDLATMAIVFFNLLNTNRAINTDFIYSLSVYGEDNPLYYQQNLIDQYFRLTEQVLNDPVKLLVEAHLPFQVYNSIDFLSPIKIRTMETTNEYYLNRITGYKESFLPCTLELIKI